MSSFSLGHLHFDRRRPRRLRGLGFRLASSVADPLVRSRAAPRRCAENLVQGRHVCDQTNHRRLPSRASMRALRRRVELMIRTCSAMGPRTIACNRGIAGPTSSRSLRETQRRGSRSWCRCRPRPWAIPKLARAIADASLTPFPTIAALEAAGIETRGSATATPLWVCIARAGLASAVSPVSILVSGRLRTASPPRGISSEQAVDRVVQRSSASRPRNTNRPRAREQRGQLMAMGRLFAANEAMSAIGSRTGRVEAGAERPSRQVLA